MRKQKVAFIICVNDDVYASECIYYIKQLSMPKNFSIDIITVKEADSAAEGYYAAMMGSDAKYKVYLHQDVFILNRNLIVDFLKIFENPKIGMIGVLGKLPPAPCNAEFHSMWDVGYCMLTSMEGCRYLSPSLPQLEPQQDIVTVSAIDGMFMITQYDVPWNENITGWHFYDIAQCMEMQKYGYEIVIPLQRDAWILHDAIVCSAKGYDRARKKFCDLYCSRGFVYDEDTDRDYLYDRWSQICLDMERCMEQKNIEGARACSSSIEYYIDRKTLILQYLLEIQEVEQNHKKFSRVFGSNLQEQMQEYFHVAFLLRRIEFDFPIEESQELVDWILTGKITSDFILCVLRHHVYDGHKEKILKSVVDRSRI